MKVLTHEGKVLSFEYLGGSRFETLDGQTKFEVGIVTEMPDREVVKAVNAEVKGRDFITPKDVMKDVKWIAKTLGKTLVKDGAEIRCEAKGSSISLVIPEDAREDKAEGLEVGSIVAIGPNVSPKYLMNAHGIVTAINGRVTVELDEGDHDRILRASGKRWAREMDFHRGAVEVVA